MAEGRTVTTTPNGRLLSAVGAVGGAWLGGHAGERIGVAITTRQGQRGLDGILLEWIAAAVGTLAGLWLLVLLTMAMTGRAKPVLTATYAGALATLGLVAVALVDWGFDVLWSPDSRSGWHDVATAVLATLVTAASGFAGRALAARPQRSRSPAR